MSPTEATVLVSFETYRRLVDDSERLEAMAIAAETEHTGEPDNVGVGLHYRNDHGLWWVSLPNGRPPTMGYPTARDALDVLR